LTELDIRILLEWNQNIEIQAPSKIMKTKKIVIVFVGFSMAVAVRAKGQAEVSATPSVPISPATRPARAG